MKDYQRYIKALRKCAKEHENDSTFTGYTIVSDLCRDTADLLEGLEQESKMQADKAAILDKIKTEILDTLYVDSLIFGELIDFKNGKISADDVIEEFNRVTRLEVLKIIDEYKETRE